jgi:hypothetical protein
MRDDIAKKNGERWLLPSSRAHQSASPDSGTEHWTEAALRSTVERLAASADDQARYLEELGTAPAADELALEFEDQYIRVRDEGRPALTLLADALAAFGGQDNAALWSLDGLREAPEWDRVRDLARAVLRSGEIDA